MTGVERKSSTACSAPGKVLFTGGYLVLDRHFTGLVFGLSARILVIVHVDPLAPPQTKSLIKVCSPQFIEAEWHYDCELRDPGSGIRLTQSDRPFHSQRNKFVEMALMYSLSFVVTQIGNDIVLPTKIEILADKDYYTSSYIDHRQETSTQRFPNFGLPLAKIHKTGLGSSAALVTAFTAACLCAYLEKSGFELTCDRDKQTLHRLSQVAHCAAQGKIGSGFDVAAAVFGSCQYRRFSAALLTTIGDPTEDKFFGELQKCIMRMDWDEEIDKGPAYLPPGLKLVLCDVDCGSETVGMVRKVLAWREENPDQAREIWESLQAANENLSRQFSEARRSMDPGSVDTGSLQSSVRTIREHLRRMSHLANVPIEPPAQTLLIDACSEIPGVIGGVVPGAGGFDAVALLIRDDAKVLEDLSNLLRSFATRNHAFDQKKLKSVNLLDVTQEDAGVVREAPSSIPAVAL